MKIVIIDAYTINPGDLSWDALKEFGDLRMHDRTPAHLIVDRCQEAEAIITNKVPFNAETLAQLPYLKYIGVSATGYNIIDLEATREKNIVVSNVPLYGTEAVAQHTFALILELSNKVGLHSQSVLQGDWYKSPDWCYWKSPLTELAQKVMGIIGFGKIGQQVAQIAQAFGMKVIYYSPSPKESTFAQSVDLENLFQQSDIISLHTPLKENNKALINSQTISQMKPSAWLINTSRGGLIQEEELAQALNEGKLAAAALDVLSLEPPSQENPLIGAKNTLITPHNAWCAWEARKRLLEMTIANLKAFLEGIPQNVVNL